MSENSEVYQFSAGEKVIIKTGSRYYKGTVKNITPKRKDIVIITKESGRELTERYDSHGEYISNGTWNRIYKILLPLTDFNINLYNVYRDNVDIKRSIERRLEKINTFCKRDKIGNKIKDADFLNELNSVCLKIDDVMKLNEEND